MHQLVPERLRSDLRRVLLIYIQEPLALVIIVFHASMSYADYQRADGPEPLEVKEPNLVLLERLASFAPRWAVILKFRSNDTQPNQHFFPSEGLLALYQQNRLTKATLIVGLQISSTRVLPNGLVPGCYFRTLDFYLDMMKSGKTYQPIADKDISRGAHRPGWCKLPVFTALREEEGGQLMCTERQAAWKLINSAQSWCFVYAYEGRGDTIKCAMNVTPDVLWEQASRGPGVNMISWSIQCTALLCMA